VKSFYSQVTASHSNVEPPFVCHPDISSMDVKQSLKSWKLI